MKKVSVVGSMGRTLLIAAIDGPRFKQCAISWAATMLKVQVALGRMPDVSAAITFFDSVEAALTEFERLGYDSCVVTETGMGVDPAFLLDAPEHDVVIAPYPLPTLDWERAAAKFAQGCTTELPEHVANVYNFDAAKATPVDSRYLTISRADVTDMNLFTLRKGVRLAETTTVHVDLTRPATTMGHVAYTGCVGRRKQLRNF